MNFVTLNYLVCSNYGPPIILRKNAMHATLEHLKWITFNGEHLVVIIPHSKALHVKFLLLHDRAVNLIEVKVKALMLDYSKEIRKFIHDLLPLLSPNWIALHIGLGNKMKKESLLKAHVESTNYCRWTKLSSEFVHFVYFVSNCIASLEHEKNFETFIKLSVYELMLLEKTSFETAHDPCHKWSIIVIIFKCHEWKIYWTRLLPILPFL